MDCAQKIFSSSPSKTASHPIHANNKQEGGGRFFSPQCAYMAASAANRALNTVGTQTNVESTPFQWSTDQIENIESPDIDSILMPFDLQALPSQGIPPSLSSPIEFIHLPNGYEENVRNLLKCFGSKVCNLDDNIKKGGFDHRILLNIIDLQEQINSLVELTKNHIQTRSVETQTDKEEKNEEQEKTCEKEKPYKKEEIGPFPFCSAPFDGYRRKEFTELDYAHRLQKYKQDLRNIDENIRIIENIVDSLQKQFLFSISTVSTSLKLLSEDPPISEIGKKIAKKQSPSLPGEVVKKIFAKTIEQGMGNIQEMLQSLKPTMTSWELLEKPEDLLVEAYKINPQQTTEQIRLALIKTYITKFGGFQGYIQHLKEEAQDTLDNMTTTRRQLSEDSSIKRSFSLDQMPKVESESLRRRTSTGTLHPLKWVRIE